MRILRISAAGIASLLVYLMAPAVCGNGCDVILSDAETTPGYVTIAYKPLTGQLSVNTNTPAEAPLTTLGIESIDGSAIFNPENCDWEMDLFDVCTETKMVVIHAKGFGVWPNSFVLGNVLDTDISPEGLRDRIIVWGSHTACGGLCRYTPADGPNAVYLFVPEPSALTLLALGLFVLIALRPGRQVGERAQ